MNFVLYVFKKIDVLYHLNLDANSDASIFSYFKTKFLLLCTAVLDIQFEVSNAELRGSRRIFVWFWRISKFMVGNFYHYEKTL